jgi:DNA-damage-inducible protein J
MSSSTTVQVRVDEQTKTEAKKVLGALHLSMSEAICLFLRQVVLHRGIPFEVKLPNELTAKTLRESEEGIDLHAVSSVDELFEELES